MISSLSGTIRYKGLNMLVIDVGGVGYKTFVTTETALETETGSSIFIWTHLVVRETVLDIFGFLNKEELDTFELLITIPGIGPKSALSILNLAPPSMLRQAVASGDTSYLTRVSGIGKKNAEKIVLELKDKLKITKDDVPTDSTQARTDSDALEALVSLGYNEREARQSLKQVPKEVEGAGERVKRALKILSQNA